MKEPLNRKVVHMGKARTKNVGPKMRLSKNIMANRKGMQRKKGNTRAERLKPDPGWAGVHSHRWVDIAEERMTQK